MVQHPPEYSDDGKCELVSEHPGAAVNDLLQDLRSLLLRTELALHPSI